MASSFYDQIPTVLNIITQVKPKRVLDIGKGFGKYGFLTHEYLGISNTEKINPNRSLKDQSAVIIDTVEVDDDLILPHLEHLYDKVIKDDIFNTYKTLGNYDLVLMIDVIEHLDKDKAKELVDYFFHQGSALIIATPIDFFEQHLYESVYEEHISHWGLADFKSYGSSLSYQKLASGRIYFLSKKPYEIKGFGNKLILKLKRIRRAILNEL